MSNGDTTKTTPKPPVNDWERFDSMSGTRRHAAALRYPAARAYLVVIGRNPQAVRDALSLGRDSQ
jgi:hypothetical protein